MYENTLIIFVSDNDVAMNKRAGILLEGTLLFFALHGFIVQPIQELASDRIKEFAKCLPIESSFKTGYLEVVEYYHQASKETEIRKAFHAFAKNAIDNMRTANKMTDAGGYYRVMRTASRAGFT
ncbi:hypothetical protein AK812_SmicGene8003 [Symbiodinium microadriaticum]|uniref:Uncharacterized protein n=1 Tax=Symbiodinium microadriaticum TaxID=2951 RepID=A0A1Q9ELZ9_SYMMI|nr:hypothetical protein AK812_SmicGene8003 [Symbiodinium microadriaticum]